jgi:hypothetical protein
LGFSSHYDKMRSRYRDVPLGTAGENIVVRTDRVLTLNDLGKRLLVRRGNPRIHRNNGRERRANPDPGRRRSVRHLLTKLAIEVFLV